MEPVIVDLGLGNLHSVMQWCERAGVSATVSSDQSVIASAQRIIVPGQGAFARCGEQLDKGLRSVLLQRLETGTPFLGICLGMQMLFDSSEEAPGVAGLGFFRGRVRKIVSTHPDFKVPHMGWNQVHSSHPALLDERWFYFVHSYHCEPEDKTLTVGHCQYETPLCAVVARGNVLGVQFHPEKSSHAGAGLLRSFMELT